MGEAIYAWKAKRSGATMTVEGVSETGAHRVIGRVELIRNGVATTSKGRTYELRNEPPTSPAAV